MEKKNYEKPSVSEVKLDLEQTVLAACKGDSVTTAVGTGDGSCTTALSGDCITVGAS
jgi:hypothetical protein